MAHDVQVIVIGAGISGVAAASLLKQAGIKSVVLEARPRIGGRIDTSYKWKGIPIELGASWVSHLAINPLVDIAREHNIALTKSDITNVHLRGFNRGETDDLLARFGLIYLGVKQEAEKRRRSGRKDIALAPVLAKVTDAARLGKKRRAVEYFLNQSIAEPYAADYDDLSLYEWDDDYTLAPLGWRVVPEGFIKIVDVLAKGLDIRREHVVTSIAYDNDGVTVSTKKHGELRAPYAVVTVPHGVLAKKKIRFSPKLPAWKQGAIDRIHTNVSDKFWFLFPENFWKSKRDVLGRVDPAGKGRWSTWINFARYTNQPVLMVFNRTEHARALEDMDDDAVIKEAMKVLRDEWGSRIPDPVDMQRSKWLHDPFACGTLPHLPPGATSEDHRILGKPVGRVHFAGDSTDAEFPGMTYGAFLSGVREAGRILEAMLLGAR